MGLFDMFKSTAKDAFKSYDKVKLNKKLTYEELLDIMKDGTYSVGEPFITGTGIMKCIQFPPVDKYKIQVAVSGKTVMISKIYNGMGGMAKEMVGEALLSDMYDVANEENISLNRATREIGETLAALCQAKGLM